MMFPRATVEECGLWDEAYFGYWVDTDWCMRLKQMGKSIYCAPSTSIKHHEGNKRHKKKHPSRIIMFHRGALRLYAKHYTHGVVDPRTWFALIALSIRAILQIAINLPRTEDATPRDVVQAHSRESCDP